MLKLIICDVDKTLVPFDSTEIYPAMMELLSSLKAVGCKFALVTNQGGPACRDAGWGEKYPTFEQTDDRLMFIRNDLSQKLELPKMLMLICWGYLTAEDIVLIPNAVRDSTMSEKPIGWWRWWRKPGPGMLMHAMEHYKVNPDETLMIGDSEDDKLAARNAGCHFLRVNHE